MTRLIRCLVFLIFAFSSAALAVPALQLYIDGAHYDWETETWIIEGESLFDLYIVGAIPHGEDELEDVWLVVSTDSDAEPEVQITINGEQWPQEGWEFGSPPFPPEIPHGVFPAWFFTVNTGEFHSVGGVGDAVPDSAGNFFDPSQGYIDDPNHMGEIRVFGIEAPDELANLHFDAYEMEDDDDGDDEMERFAPFSHDAGYVRSETSISDGRHLLARGFATLSAYPNPFNAQTRIEFSLRQASDIQLQLFDLRGRKVAELASGRYDAGVHSITWQGRNSDHTLTATGVYFVRLTSDQGIVTRRVVMLK